MEALVCKCCGAPLKNDKCEYCGVSYTGIKHRDAIKANINWDIDEKFSYINLFENCPTLEIVPSFL